MRRSLRPRPARVLLAAVAAAPLTALALASRAPADDVDARLRRGRYLVHEVAMCVQCHSPRDGDGELLPARLLTGAPMPLESPWPDETWAFRAPYLRGLPGYDDAQGVRLLTKGLTPRGGRPRPPMPPFRMTTEDAEAVVAYLRSLD